MVEFGLAVESGGDHREERPRWFRRVGGGPSRSRTASAACMASQVLVATTAIPSPRSTTRSTPGMAIARARVETAHRAAQVPGSCARWRISSPAARTSMPKVGGAGDLGQHVQARHGLAQVFPLRAAGAGSHLRRVDAARHPRPVRHRTARVPSGAMTWPALGRKRAARRGPAAAAAASFSVSRAVAPACAHPVEGIHGRGGAAGDLQRHHLGQDAQRLASGCAASRSAVIVLAGQRLRPSARRCNRPARAGRAGRVISSQATSSSSATSGGAGWCGRPVPSRRAARSG